MVQPPRRRAVDHESVAKKLPLIPLSATPQAAPCTRSLGPNCATSTAKSDVCSVPSRNIRHWDFGAEVTVTLACGLQGVVAGNRGFCQPNPRWQGEPQGGSADPDATQAR